MRSFTTERFRKLYLELPNPIRGQARQAYKRFMENPNHPGLEFKKVRPTKPIYSARINLNYRASGVLDGDEIVWFWIGSHADYDKILSRL